MRHCPHQISAHGSRSSPHTFPRCLMKHLLGASLVGVSCSSSPGLLLRRVVPPQKALPHVHFQFVFFLHSLSQHTPCLPLTSAWCPADGPTPLGCAGEKGLLMHACASALNHSPLVRCTPSVFPWWYAICALLSMKASVADHRRCHVLCVCQMSVMVPGCSACLLN